MTPPIVTELRMIARTSPIAKTECASIDQAADTIEALLATMEDFAEWEPESGVTLEHLAAWMKERAGAAIATALGLDPLAIAWDGARAPGGAA
jgi:hypothetical protein